LTTVTILPAQPGWEVVIARKSGLWLEPIIGWAVTTFPDNDDEGFDHYPEPLTAEGPVRQVWPKLHWGIRNPSGRIEFCGKHYTRVLDLEVGLSKERAA
jgi:hypothetical protein